MSARRHGRRRATPFSGLLGRTGSRISSLSGQADTSPSSSANWWGQNQNWNVWWSSSGTTLHSAPAVTTTYASSYVYAAQAELNKLLSDWKDKIALDIEADLRKPNPLYELFAEAPAVALDEDDGA